MRHQAEALAGRLPPLLVAAERVAATVAQGVHGRRRVGRGDSFWEFRPYVAGDPVTRIDWRETAKGERAYVRETEWEAAQSVWLWLDRSASMAWRSDRNLPSKAERAGLLLLALAVLLVRGGERVALLGGGQPPSASRVQVERLALGLARPDPVRAGPPPVEDLPRHADLVLIGDFLTPVEELGASLRRFAGQGVRGHLLQVLDPAEESLPFEGRVRFEGVEGEGATLIGRVEAVRDQYVARLAAHRSALARMAGGLGWSFAVHHTDQAPQAALLALHARMS
jgi:uncharacterized protein (DUF58 family)